MASTGDAAGAGGMTTVGDAGDAVRNRDLTAPGRFRGVPAGYPHGGRTTCEVPFSSLRFVARFRK